MLAVTAQVQYGSRSLAQEPPMISSPPDSVAAPMSVIDLALKSMLNARAG
jgi:hypothetical protein